MAFGMENTSGSTGVENFYYKCTISEPSTAGVSSQTSRDSPREPDFQDWPSLNDDGRRGQRPFERDANKRSRHGANRDSGYASWPDGSPVSNDYDRHHRPDSSPDRHPEQYRAHPYGFHTRGGSDTAGRPRNNTGNGEYTPRRDYPHEGGQYDPVRNSGHNGNANEDPNRFQPPDDAAYGRERSHEQRPYAYTSPQRFPSPDRGASYPTARGPGPHQYADTGLRYGDRRDAGPDRYASPGPSVGPPSVPPDEGYYEGGRSRYWHRNAGETDRGSEAYYGTRSNRPPSRERYDYEGTRGRNWFNNVGPDPHAERDHSDMSSVASPPRPTSPEMNDGSSGTRSLPMPDMSGDNPWSDDGSTDVHRQCGINPQYIWGQRVCRHRRGHFCRDGTAKRRSR